MKIDPLAMINLKTLGSNVKKPDKTRNYCLFNDNRVDYLAQKKEEIIPNLKEKLQNTNDENAILETLAVINKMADDKNLNLESLYPYLARFNETDSPDVQVMLSGIYRKILVPDAFGPLIKMLHKQINSNSEFFDPTEETGGAILEYIKSYGAINAYQNAHFALRQMF